jgi:cell division protease FtsH
VSDNKDNNNPNQNPKPIGGPNRIALIILIVSALFILYFLYTQFMSGNEISYDQFLTMVQSGELLYDEKKPVVIYESGKITGWFTDNEGKDVQFQTMMPRIYDDADLYNTLKENNVIYQGGSDSNPLISMFLFNILPIGALIFIIWFMFRQFQGSGNRAFTFGKSKAKKFEPKEKITFKDVAGIDEAKEELGEVVEFLRDPQKFTRIGAKIPKGCLLVGPPGTGKTLLARAVAGEAGVSFFHMSGSDFVEMFVGVGASRVRDLFETGRKNAPCILFVDELDAVGRTRGAGYGGGHDEREQTLNQLLVEMDGFDPTIGVILVAATNRPDVLDPALLRPGRFDRQVVVDRPDINGREEILHIHSRKVILSTDVDLKKIARATPGFSGADLANMVNEAALYAARYNKKKVTMVDFEEARDKLIMGVARKSRIIPDNIKRVTAYHEAGHAIITMMVENADPLHKVSVIPRGMALGITSSLPEQEQFNYTRNQLHDIICMMMGGRVAEEIFFDDIDSGASSDISRATEMARKMVTQWGMTSALGPIAYGQKDEPIFIGKEIATHKEYSDKTAELIDAEVTRIVMDEYKRAHTILKANKKNLEKLAEALIKQETMDAEEIYNLLGLEMKHVDAFDEKDSVKPATEDKPVKKKKEKEPKTEDK